MSADSFVESADRPVTAPYGSWASPIGADLVAAGGIRLGTLSWSGDDLYWLEGRPTEGGRSVLVRRTPAGQVSDVFPDGFNARTLAHEYGGGSFWLWGPVAFFTNFDDQRVYRVDPGSAPVPITPQPLLARGDRYADGVVTPDGAWIICVRERHMSGREPINELVALPTDGSAPPRTLVTGNAFYSFPRLSPDGAQLAWTCWNHPQMPWDGTELWVAEVGPRAVLGSRRFVAGGRSESIFQPSFSPQGVLHWVSDRTGWWNLYVERGSEQVALAPREAEFGGPQWVFGLSTYAFAGTDLVCLAGSPEGTRLSRLDEAGALVDLGLAFRTFSPATLSASGSRLALVAGSPTQAAAVVICQADGSGVEVVRPSLTHDVDPALISVAEAITFPSTLEGEEVSAHALYYAPHNPGFAAPSGELPPLVVMSHGGPTSASSSELSIMTQFFTSRGFAVVDVNYGGSTGYGRAYRDRLKGRWGVLDVDDCIAAAEFLAGRGDVDRARMAIRGGSAGGYTTLCALTFRDCFAAGASYYGVADAATLARDTHKFETRYLDSLIGPYPAEERLYRERSPIHHTDQLSCPIILLQGAEDMVVPPDQAEQMVAALRRKGLPFAYLLFEGEQHGFRRAENIQRALEAEASFYAQVFGFQLAGGIPEISIENR